MLLLWNHDLKMNIRGNDIWCQKKLIRQLFRTQDQAVIRRLSEISETVIYKKRQEIHKAGETYTHFYMLLRGAVYTYFYDEHQHPVVLLLFFGEE